MVKIFDPLGREITIGALARGGGRVVSISEPEGDYNAYGRAVMYGPYVTLLVRGEEHVFGCQPERWSDYEKFTCDDVVLR